jgi:hypothetical protein
MEAPQIGGCPAKAYLIGRLGEPPNDDECPVPVNATELGHGVSAGDYRQRLVGSKEGEREAHGLVGGGRIDRSVETVQPLHDLVVHENLKPALGAREGAVEDICDLGDPEALRPLREREERLEGVLGGDEASHEQTITLSA